MAGFISVKGLEIISWVFLGITIFFTFLRLILRFRQNSRFMLDDVLQALACAVLIVYVALYVSIFGFLTSSSDPTEDQTRDYFRKYYAISFIFFIILYLVKFSFLALYRHIFWIDRRFHTPWYIVTAFTAVTGLACFLSTFWICGSPASVTDPLACEEGGDTTALFITWCPLNVLSDIAIMILPLNQLRRLNMPLSQKLSLALLFLLATITVIFDILRSYYSIDVAPLTKESFWDIFEPIIAVLLCALPGLRPALVFSIAHVRSLSSLRRSKSTSAQKLSAESWGTTETGAEAAKAKSTNSAKDKVDTWSTEDPTMRDVELQATFWRSDDSIGTNEEMDILPIERKVTDVEENRPEKKMRSIS